jgi:hypothetical protein
VSWHAASYVLMYNIALSHWQVSLHLYGNMTADIKFIFPSYYVLSLLCITCIIVHSAHLTDTLSPHPHIHHITHIWGFDCSGHVLTQQFYSYVCIFLKYQGPSNFFNSSLTSRTSILCVLLPRRLTPTFNLLLSQMIVGCTYCLSTKLRNQCLWDGSQMLKT